MPALARTMEPATLRLFEDILRRGVGLRVKVTGRSMAPFLRGGEIVTIRKVASSSLRRGDLIFFRTADGSPVIHRVVRTLGGTTRALQTSGDALLALDAPVGPADILGKVCIVERPDGQGGFRRLDLESARWRAVNGLIALGGLAAAALYSALARLAGRRPCARRHAAS